MKYEQQIFFILIDYVIIEQIIESVFSLYIPVPSLTVGKIKMATNPVNMGSVAVFYFVTICAIL